MYVGVDFDTELICMISANRESVWTCRCRRHWTSPGLSASPASINNSRIDQKKKKIECKITNDCISFMYQCMRGHFLLMQLYVPVSLS